MGQTSFAETVAKQPSSTVLLVDDEPSILKVLSRLLVKLGIAVECETSAPSAVARLAAGAQYDAIISDVSMPDLSGLDLLRALRDVDADVSVILVTGAPALEGAVEALEHGAFRYLQKPLDPSRFLSDVEKAVLRSRELRIARRRTCGADCTTCRPGSQCAKLTRAFDRLRPVFQPIVSWRERRAFGYEGLIRCDEPSLEHPERLFDLAERFGKLPELGRSIRDQMAEAAIAAMPADAVLFVNVHPADVQDPRLFDGSSPLASIASRVVLEITERSSLSSVVDVAERLRALREMGFRIAIDDLGAGYAGLSSFSLLEPDIAKLDMSLIRGIDGAERKRRVVRSLIHLCQEELGVQVVCEGIETESERNVLIDLGADLLQGYLFARPATGFPTPLAHSLPPERAAAAAP